MMTRIDTSPNGFRKARLVQAVQHALLAMTFGSSLFAVSTEVAGRSGDTSAAFASSQVIRQFTLRNTVAQANQILQSQIAEVGGKPRGAAMGAPGAFFPASMGSVPVGFGIPQRDGNGRLMGYCAWDNTTDTDTASYRGGLSMATQLVYAVVSPGLNGAFETSCDTIEVSGAAGGDDYLEIRLNSQQVQYQYRSSVATLSDLNTTPGLEGDVRLVLENNRLYSFVGGSWQAVSSTGSFVDDSATNGANALAYTLGKVTVADFEATTATLSSNLSVGGTSTLTGAVTASNGITVSSGGLNVTGNTNITGTTAITGNTTVTGTFTANNLVGNASGLTDMNAGNINSGVLATAYGGTGVDASAAANGALLIGNGSGFSLATLTAGAGVSITNAAGSITIANTGVTQFNGRTGDVILTLDDVNGVVTYNSQNVRLGTGALATSSTAPGLTAIGVNALNVQTTGGFNTAVGYNALALTTAGSENTAIGEGALQNNTTGSNNTAVGRYALNTNISGTNNTAVGRYALLNNSSGSYNVALGPNALDELTSGSYNSALGSNAGPSSSTTTLSYSTAIGADSEVSTSNTIVLGRTTDITVIGATGTATSGLLQNKKLQVTGDVGVTGNQEIGGNITLTGALNGVSFKTITSGLTNPAMAIGSNNLLATHTGTGSTLAIGYSALASLTTGAENVAIGYNSMQNNTVGDRNIALGAFTLRSNTTGSDNTALGHRALSANTTGDANTGLGDSTLRENTIGYRNTAAGENAMRFNIDGHQNSAYGMDSLHSNISGYDNVAMGHQALYANTTGHSNTVLGQNALSSNTTGNENTALGKNSMALSEGGIENVALGIDSLYNLAGGAFNTFAGNNSGRALTTGQYSSGIGYEVLHRLTTGSRNTAVGTFALDRVTTGDNNTALGYGAGANSNNGVTTGTHNTFLGFEAQPGTSTQLNYATSIGASSRVNTSNTIVLGRSTDTTVIGASGAATSGNLLGGKLQVTGDIRATGNVYAAGVQLTSDRRLKTDINQIGSDLILGNLSKLNAYKYRLINDPSGQVRVGVIAQELALLFPELASVGASGYYSVDYSALGTLAAAGVGRLSMQFDVLSKTVEQQGEEITSIKTRLDGVDTRVIQLEGWKSEAVGRMDKMQSAIDLNIEKIAANALAIASNAEKVTTLEQITQQIDLRLSTAEGTLAKVDADWNNSFSRSEDGQTLTVKTPNLVASNFSAEQIRARAAYTERLEAEMARIRVLEVDSLKANTAVARNLQAEVLNTGSAQVYAGVGSPAFLFAATADGHYAVNTSALDGSYATATIIVNAGQAMVVKLASEGIELIAEGSTVKAVAAGKSIRASWIKMG